MITADELYEMQRKAIFEHGNMDYIERELKSLNRGTKEESLVLLNLSDPKSLKWNSTWVCEQVPNLYIQKMNRILERRIPFIFRLVIIQDHEYYYMNGEVKTKKQVAEAFRAYADKFDQGGSNAK